MLHMLYGSEVKGLVWVQLERSLSKQTLIVATCEYCYLWDFARQLSSWNWCFGNLAQCLVLLYISDPHTHVHTHTFHRPAFMLTGVLKICAPYLKMDFLLTVLQFWKRLICCEEYKTEPQECPARRIKSNIHVIVQPDCCKNLFHCVIFVRYIPHFKMFVRFSLSMLLFLHSLLELSICFIPFQTRWLVERNKWNNLHMKSNSATFTFV